MFAGRVESWNNAPCGVTEAATGDSGSTLPGGLRRRVGGSAPLRRGHSALGSQSRRRHSMDTGPMHLHLEKGPSDVSHAFRLRKNGAAGAVVACAPVAAEAGIHGTETWTSRPQKPSSE
jgi:hypothetical protein